MVYTGDTSPGQSTDTISLPASLANAEMRLLLALFLFNFDLEMPKEYIGWAEKQQFFGLWARGPLEIYLRPRL